MLGPLAANSCDATTMVRVFADGFDVACVPTGFTVAGLTAGFVTAGLVATDRLTGAFFTAAFFSAGFGAADFLVVAAFVLASREPDCFATGFRAVVVPAGFRAFSIWTLALAVVDCRACERDAAAFWVALLLPARFVPVPPARAAFTFVARFWAAFGRETFTSPRIARPDDPPFAAALTVARRVDLLCEVEAMGTTLVTVVTR